MQVDNIKYYKGADFAMYKAMPGLSYSGIKGGEIAATPKMMLGTAVHNYLLEPENFNHEQRDVVIPIVQALRSEIGDVLKYAQTELSVTADFTHLGNTFAYKGRIDILLNDLVIDLKVSSQPLDKSIAYFGYDKQVNGYMLATLSKTGMIIRICPKTKKIEKKIIAKDTTFWEWICELHGIPSFIF